MGKKRRRSEGKQSRDARAWRGPADDIRLTTAEGDEVMIATVRYRHAAPREIVSILQETPDFELDDDSEGVFDREGDSVGLWDFVWLETRHDAPDIPAPMGQRILAFLTLTGTTLEAEAMSVQRLDDCRLRLEQLLGARIRLLETRTKTLEQAMSDIPPAEPEEPFLPPPEVIAEIEERMLREWIDESIPALGGLTPREAVKTPEGREKVLALIEAGAEMRRAMLERPGTLAPDYRKVKKMLGLA